MDRLIECEPAPFREGLGRHGFSFAHTLGNHPLFELERLARLADTMLTGPHPEKFALMDAQHNSMASKFGHMRERPPLLETFRRIRAEGLWVRMTSVEEADPDYAGLLRRVIEETEVLTGLPLRRTIEWSALSILLDSPLIAVPYHMDHEFNLLLQVQGEKEVHVFDGTDRSILSEPEIERFYLNDFDAPSLRNEAQKRARSFRLNAGAALHIPPLSPHWVRNGDCVSVSASFIFSTRTLNARAKVFQANHFIRGLGLHPSEPEGSHLCDAMRLSDRIKSASMRMLSKRSPRSRHELIFSGVDRLGRSVEIVNRLRKRLLGDR